MKRTVHSSKSSVTLDTAEFKAKLMAKWEAEKRIKTTAAKLVPVEEVATSTICSCDSSVTFDNFTNPTGFPLVLLHPGAAGKATLRHYYQ